MVEETGEDYAPIKDELNTQVAFWQAATVLDRAVKIALRDENVDTLITLSALWMELGEKMLIDVEEDEESDRPVTVGFTGKEQNERVK